MRVLITGGAGFIGSHISERLLESGKYDLNKVAVIISQTGGGCRASNYIAFIRRALKKCQTLDRRMKSETGIDREAELKLFLMELADRK